MFKLIEDSGYSYTFDCMYCGAENYFYYDSAPITCIECKNVFTVDVGQLVEDIDCRFELFEVGDEEYFGISTLMGDVHRAACGEPNPFDLQRPDKVGIGSKIETPDGNLFKVISPRTVRPAVGVYEFKCHEKRLSKAQALNWVKDLREETGCGWRLVRTFEIKMLCTNDAMSNYLLYPLFAGSVQVWINDDYCTIANKGSEYLTKVVAFNSKLRSNQLIPKETKLTAIAVRDI